MAASSTESVELLIGRQALGWVFVDIRLWGSGFRVLLVGVFLSEFRVQGLGFRISAFIEFFIIRV